MTVEVNLICDANGCYNKFALYDMPSDKDISAAGWHTHPDCPEDHYCNKCWPVVKKEIEGIRNKEA